MNQDQSEIISGKGGTTFAGKDAVNLYRAITLKNALIGYHKFKMIPTRGVTATSMLTLAKQYTGKTYKRGQHLEASQDVEVWIQTMKSALPITHR